MLEIFPACPMHGRPGKWWKKKASSTDWLGIFPDCMRIESSAAPKARSARSISSFDCKLHERRNAGRASIANESRFQRSILLPDCVEAAPLARLQRNSVEHTRLGRLAEHGISS